MTILYADAGGTKTDWLKVHIGKDGKKTFEIYTGCGISPVHHESESIEEELQLVRTELGGSFDKIRFYGTGIGSQIMTEEMATILSEIFECHDIVVDSDMAGAAMSALGDKPGIACIMGTGSNSCHYDGSRIDRKSASLGYILDDEGGGVAFGRCLLSGVFKKLAPPEICEIFNERYNLKVSDVIEKVYRQPGANKWIAGFMPFIVDNIDKPYIKEMVEKQIHRFFDREFAGYTEFELREQGIGFVGGVAWELRDMIHNEMDRRGWKMAGMPQNGILDTIKNRI